jgi:two-component system LytT family sensor kinase
MRAITGQIRSCVAVFAVWTVIVVVFTAHEYLSYAADGRPGALLHVLYWSASEWYLWALLTPAVLLAAQRFPIGRHHWLAHTLLHVALALVFSTMQIALAYALDRAAVAVFASGEASLRTWLSGATASAPATLAYLISRKTGFNVVVYTTIVLAGHLIGYYSLYRSRELRAARLEAELSRARLDALRSQLEPHFLFNSLNGIAEMVHVDAHAAERMIEDLAQLLRRALATSGPDEVPLSDELELLDAYCALERVRLGERLRLAREIEPQALHAHVPALLLQPLIENAVRYAVQPRADGGRVVLRAGRRNNRLFVEVEDDGPGPSSGARDGVGLGNSRSRLATLYGAAHRFELSRAHSGGSLVTIELPWHIAPHAQPVEQS